MPTKYEVPGQDNMKLLVGAGGDKTISVSVTTTHVRLTNLDGSQRVKYAVKNNPALADWSCLNPGQKLVVKVTDPVVYLRKRVFFRYSSIGETRNDAVYDPPEVKATVEVEQFDMS